MCPVKVGLTVHCVCASCLCAAGNSKTRPYRPPRGLRAQGVPEQHGLNKKKRKKTFQKLKWEGKKNRQRTHAHARTDIRAQSAHLINPWLELYSGEHQTLNHKNKWINLILLDEHPCIILKFILQLVMVGCPFLMNPSLQTRHKPLHGQSSTTITDHFTFCLFRC